MNKGKRKRFDLTAPIERPVRAEGVGHDLQRLSESATWRHYLRLHPRSKVGFCHSNNRLYFTLHDHSLGHRGVIKYANTITELIEVAHLALWEQGEVEVI